MYVCGSACFWVIFGTGLPQVAFMRKTSQLLGLSV